MSKVFKTAFLFLMLSCTIAPAISSELSDIVANSVSKFIQPGYSHFARQTNLLKQSAGKFCANLARDNTKKLRQEFSNTVLAWAGIEAVRFGPIIDNNNFERIFFWPDPKGIGIRQVAKLLRKEPVDQSAATVGRKGN